MENQGNGWKADGIKTWNKITNSLIFQKRELWNQRGKERVKGRETLGEEGSEDRIYVSHSHCTAEIRTLVKGVTGVYCEGSKKCME